MEIIKTKNDCTLTLALSGRLDTTTSPELETALNESIDGIENLKFDLTNLEYISSAGLRVLLGAQKIMNKQGEMVVANANDDIREVFEITGFSDILTLI